MIYFLEDRGMLKRVLWAIGRIGEVHPTLTRGVVPRLKEFLRDPEPEISGTAAWTLGKLGALNGLEGLDELKKISPG